MGRGRRGNTERVTRRTKTRSAVYSISVVALALYVFDSTRGSLAVSSVFQISAGVVAGAVAFKAWEHRDRACGLPLFFMSVSSAVVAVSWGMSLLFEDTIVEYVLVLLGHQMGLGISLGAMYLAFEYVDKTELKNHLNLALVGVLMIADFLFVFTDPLHGLYSGTGEIAAGIYPEGVLALFRLLYSASFGVIAIGVFVDYSRDAGGIHRRQTIAIAAGGVIALITVILEVFSLIHTPRFNFITVAIAVSCAVLLWAMFEGDFPKVTPIARKTLMRSMEDAVMALDHEGHIVDANARAREAFGVGKDSVGEPVEEALSDCPELAEALNGKRGTETEVSVETDGERRYYDVNVSSVVHEDEGADSPWSTRSSEAVDSVAVVRDVTDKMLREQALERKSRRMDRFTDFVSHDLRNSLDVALMNTKLAKEEHEVNRLDEVEDSIDNVERVVSNLSRVTQVDRTELEEERVDIGATAQVAWGGIKTEDASLVAEEDGTIMADRSCLAQLLENLFRNSIEHGSDSSGETSSESGNGAAHVDEGLEVTVGVLGGNEGFYVEDDGKGIQEGRHDEVLEHGYSTSDNGRGFGMSIVRTIAEEHGWEIRVTDSRDGGARFEFRGAVVEEHDGKSAAIQ